MSVCHVLMNDKRGGGVGETLTKCDLGEGESKNPFFQVIYFLNDPLNERLSIFLKLSAT